MITATEAALLSLSNEDLQKELADIECQIKDAAKKGLRRITITTSKSAITTIREIGYVITTQPKRNENGCFVEPQATISW